MTNSESCGHTYASREKEVPDPFLGSLKPRAEHDGPKGHPPRWERR